MDTLVRNITSVGRFELAIAVAFIVAAVVFLVTGRPVGDILLGI